MPKADDAKTASAPRAKYLFGWIAVILILCGFGGMLWASANNKYSGGDFARCAFSVPSTVQGRFRPYPKECMWLEIADTDAERVQGLSGRKELLPYYGMLFVFDQAGRQCMWMKGMNFSIDIIWVGEDRRINKIEKDVSPDTYPQSFCSDDAKYVIEVNPGTADRAGLRLGKKLAL